MAGQDKHKITGIFFFKHTIIGKRTNQLEMMNKIPIMKKIPFLAAVKTNLQELLEEYCILKDTKDLNK